MEQQGLVRIGITGHTNLSRSSAVLVYDALLAVLQRYSGCALRGVTCLAEGADQIFARAVLAARGTYEVILPSRDYRSRVRPGNIGNFDSLLEQAVDVSYASWERPGEAAYAAANAELLRRCDHLLAVWDGRPCATSSSSAQVVVQAGHKGLPVTRIWPAGTRRVQRRRPKRD